MCFALIDTSVYPIFKPWKSIYRIGIPSIVQVFTWIVGAHIKANRCAMQEGGVESELCYVPAFCRMRCVQSSVSNGCSKGMWSYYQWKTSSYQIDSLFWIVWLEHNRRIFKWKDKKYWIWEKLSLLCLFGIYLKTI